MAYNDMKGSTIGVPYLVSQENQGLSFFAFAYFSRRLIEEIRKNSETRMRGRNPHPECNHKTDY